MKSLKWLLCWLLALPLLANGQWKVQDPGLPERYEIKHVQALTPDLVWICANGNPGAGEQPFYSFTQDGGESWSAGIITDQSNLVPGHLFAFSAFPAAFTVLYKSDENGEGQAGVYATFDNGETWTRQPGAFEHPEAFPDIVYFWSTLQGIAIGDPVDGEFDIYLTSDLGSNWNKIPGVAIPDPLPEENAIVRTFSVVGNSIWFSTTKGRVYKSENIGLSWSVSSSPFNSHTRVAFTSPLEGYLQDVGDWETSGLAQTNDGGTTWETVNYNGNLLNWDLKYVPGTIHTLLSSGAYLRLGLTMSMDGGNNWNSVLENYKIVQMDWIDLQTGWVGCVLDYGPESWKSFMLKYTGPGLGDFMVSPLEMDFGDIAIGQSSEVGMVFTNLGTEPVEVVSIESLTDEYTLSESTFVVQPSSQYYITVFFSPTSEGYFDGQLNILCDHPQLAQWNAILHGRGVLPANDFVFDPDGFDENLLTGEREVRNLSFTNNNDIAYGWEIVADPAATLSAPGWRYGYTPLDGDDGILDQSPDQAMFIKDISIQGDITQATLRLGYDDGIRVWINGEIALDAKTEAHALEYWNQEVDITNYLHPGINRITAVVFNGVIEGDGGGGFDCELEVDGQYLIKRGDENSGEPEAKWFYFGETGQQLIPTSDVYARQWWEKDFGRFQWLSLNSAPVSATADQFDLLGWSYWSAPFGGNEFLLNESPDNAFFIKDFEIETHEEAILYLSYDDGCMVILNGGLLFDFSEEVHGGEYWNKELDISENLIEGRNRISIIVLNGVYDGGGSGYFDCQLVVDGVNKISRGDSFYGEPEAFWHVYGMAGQVLTPPDDASGRLWWEMNYANVESPLTSSLGWKYNSTPVNENENLLYIPPDNAQFIKDIEIEYFEEAILYVGFDDGCRIWINGILEFDFYDEVHGLNYWDRELDVSWILQPGRNRIAIEVYNGIYGGGAYGGFDAQLLVDGTEIIKRGDENYGEPEAMWFMFGEAGKVLTPPDDANGLDWYQKDYGASAYEPAAFTQGVINPWQTGNALVVMDATGLTPGEYNGLLRFRTTGTRQEWEIPVNLYVEGAPEISFEPETLDFGDFFIGFPETQQLRVFNKGSDLLELFEIFTLDGVISVAIGQQTIEPGESAIFDVTIDPYITGEFTSALVFITNDPLNFSAFVPINAQVLNAPDIELPNLDYLLAILEPGGTEILDFSIYNNGEIPSELNFTIPQVFGEKHFEAKKEIPDMASGINSGPEASITARSQHSMTSPAKIKNDYLLKNIPPRDGNEIMIFSDDMENGATGWKVENYLETESQWHLVSFNSSSPDHSWWCGNELTGTYWNGNRVFEAVVSPEILLPPYGNAVYMTFDEFYELEGDYDVRNVDISTDGGENWQRIFEQSGALSETWLAIQIDISEFAGNKIMLKFLFDTGDEVANLFAGWFIDDVRIFSPGFPFITVDPGSGSVFSGEYQNMLVTFDAAGYDPGFYPGFFLIISNDPDENYYYLPANLQVELQSNIHYIDLPQGWSGLSSYRMPYSSAIEEVFAPIAGELIVAQTMDDIYYPGENINTIVWWQEQSAYKIKTLSPCTLSVFGDPEEDLQFELDPGWNLVPVIAPCPVNVAELFQTVGENLTIVKDVANVGVYWPAMNINTIGELQPGKAYFALMNSDGDVEFPLCGKSGSFSGLLNLTGFQNLSGLGITPTPSTHTIAILPSALEGFAQETIIGACDQAGSCFGATVYDTETISMTLFGDDPTTAVKDGFFEGEMIFFKNLTGLTNLSGLNPTFDPQLPSADGLFTGNGLSAITAFEALTSTDNKDSGTNISIYPNPATGLLNITGLTAGAGITVSDAKGQIIMSTAAPTDGLCRIDLSLCVAGVYLVKIQQNGNQFFRKLVLQ